MATVVRPGITRFRDASDVVAPDGAGDDGKVWSYDHSLTKSKLITLAAETAASILAKLLTVDTDDSGLNATTLKSTTPTAYGLSLLDDANAAAARTTLGLGTIATENDAPADGAFYGRQNTAWVAAATLPVVDDTAIIHKTSFPSVTQTHDITAYTAARVVAWPDAGITVAGLEISNLFAQRQDVRGSGSGLAAGIYAPWVSGDTLNTIVAGSSNSGNNRVAVYGESYSQNGVRGISNTSAGVSGTSTSGTAVLGTSTSGSGGQFVSTSGRGVSCQSNTGEPMDAIQVTGSNGTVADLFVIRKRPLTTAADGFGSALVFKLSSDTAADQFAGRLQFLWATAAHGTRKARSIWTVYDTAEREGVRIETNGSAPMVGFLGAAATVRAAAYTQTYSTADRTLSAYTPDAESGAYTGIDNLQVGTVYAQLADLNALRVAYENLRAFVEDIAGVLNSHTDDLQAFGLAA